MKALLKLLMNALATLIVLPVLLLYAIAALVTSPVRAFPGFSQALAGVPGTSGIYLRRAFYRWTLAECGVDASIGYGTLISHPTASIGARAYIGPYCLLGDTTIEADAVLGSNVSVMNGTAQHGFERLDIPIREQPGVYTRVTVGRDSWLGERAIVMCDVGEQCVVGAGSIVTRPLPPRAIAVGSPAKVIRFRGESENSDRYDEIHDSKSCTP